MNLKSLTSFQMTISYLDVVGGEGWWRTPAYSSHNNLTQYLACCLLFAHCPMPCALCLVLLEFQLQLQVGLPERQPVVFGYSMG